MMMVMPMRRLQTVLTSRYVGGICYLRSRSRIHHKPNAIDNATPPPNPPTVVQASPPPLGVVPQTPVAQSSTETELHDLSTFPTNSPSKNQEAVTQYLLEKEKEGKQLNTVEVEGLIAMLKKASEGTSIDLLSSWLV